MRVRLSILDLAPIGRGHTAGESFAASVALARRAEVLGYYRGWYAEHHHMPSIASSATSVLIAHIGAHTRSIRLGAGGGMLPNHSPLVIAEQFGTLDAMHPGRIDPGLGRAPGADPTTQYAPRRDPRAGDTFPRDGGQLLASGGAFVDQILTYTAAGTPAEVRDYLDGFIKQTEADELMTVHNALTPEARLRSVTLLAEAMQ